LSYPNYQYGDTSSGSSPPPELPIGIVGARVAGRRIRHEVRHYEKHMVKHPAMPTVEEVAVGVRPAGGAGAEDACADLGS